jgi:formylglycine-generating enzyme required for sulfatase activity
MWSSMIGRGVTCQSIFTRYHRIVRVVAICVVAACTPAPVARPPAPPRPVVIEPSYPVAVEPSQPVVVEPSRPSRPIEPVARTVASAVEMAHVPATRFRMGSRNGRPDELPVHAVDVAAFSIDLTEVTVAAYSECVAAKRCTVPPRVRQCDWYRDDLRGYPINCVSWEQASAFCAFAGKRLPTEDEWELAARGTDGRSLPWGNGAMGGEECEITHLDPPLCPVASRPSGRSAFGLYDMTGNVDEWTATTYCPYDHPGCRDTRRVSRGGASDFIGGTATSRTAIEPQSIGEALGFRCARSE